MLGLRPTNSISSYLWQTRWTLFRKQARNNIWKWKHLIFFHFLVNFVRHTGPMVTRCTGSLSQLPVVEMSWGKKSKKKTSVPINFRFLVNFIRHTGPIVTMVTRCTGSLSELPVAKMSWGKKSKKKLSVLFHFVFWSMSSDTLVPWSPCLQGAQAAYLSLHSRNELGEKNLRKNQVFCFISFSGQFY